MSNPGAPPDDLKAGLDAYAKMKQQMGQPVEDTTAVPAQTDPLTPPDTQPQGTIAPPTPGEDEDQPGIMSRIATGAKNLVMHPVDTLTGALAGVARVPGETVGAAMDLSKDVYDATGATDAAHNFSEYLANAPEKFPGQKALGATLLAYSPLDHKGSFADTLSSKEYLGKIGNSSVNDGVANIGSLVLGAGVLGEEKLFSGLPKIAQGALNFGLATFGLQDPDSQRFSSALNNLGVHSEFTDWLGADASQAGPMENRFKNAIEGTVGGALFDTVFQGAKYLRSVLKGAPDATAKEAATAAASEAIPEAAHPQASVVTATEEGGATTVHVDGEPVVSLPKASYDDLLDEATRASAPRAPTAEELAAAPDATTGLEGDFRGNKVEFGDAAHIVRDTANPEAGDYAQVSFDAGTPRNDNPRFGAALPGMDNESVAPLLRSMAIKLHDTPHVVRSDAERNAMAIAAAKEVGVDPSDMIAYAKNVAGDLSDSDVGVTTTQILWRKMAGDLDTLAQKGLAEGAPEEEIQAHKSAIANAVSFSGSFQAIRSSLGRGLRSTAILRKVTDYVGDKLGVDDASSKLFKESNPVPPQPNTVQEINDFHSYWNGLKGDPAARQNFLRGIQTLPNQWKYLRTSFANNFTANALAGLPSVSMNMFGPLTIGVLHTLEKTTGGFLNALNPLLSASERAANLAVATNSSRAYLQTVMDIPDAFRWAVQAGKENRSVLGGGNTVDVNRMGPISDSMLRAANMKDGTQIGYQLGNLINWWPRNFQRANAGLDEFAKRLSYMGETRLNAAVEYDTNSFVSTGGADAGRNARPQDLAASKGEYIKSAMENSIDAVGDATNETALRTAERTTFTGGLSGNDYHPLVGKAAEFIQQMRSQFPETRLIIPVFNVPANSIGETMRRIPGVNYFLGETRDELAGKLGAVRQADAYGRTMLGAAFMLWAYHASRQGTLTGAGPQDPSNQKAWKDQGYQPYSFRMGDKWVDYSRYDLPGSLLGIPANMFDSTVYHRQDDPGYEARMIGSIGALAQYFKDKASLQGAANLMNFGGSPSSDESFFDRTWNNAVTKTFVPNFVTQLGRNTQDNEKRSVTSTAESLMNALPMTSKELDPMRNVLGEPLHTPRDTLLENVLPLTIAPATTFKSDPVMSELDRLRQATGVAPGVTHPSEFDGNYFDSATTKLEDGHSLYDHLIAARMTTVDPDTGDNLRTALQKMFASPDYKNAKDGDASNLVDSDGNVSRGAIVAKYFSAYNKAAVRTVAQQSPIAKQWLAVAAAKKIDDDRLRPYPAAVLVSNPGLVKSLGIDMSQFEQKVSGQP